MGKKRKSKIKNKVQKEKQHKKENDLTVTIEEEKIITINTTSTSNHIDIFPPTAVNTVPDEFGEDEKKRKYSLLDLWNYMNTKEWYETGAKYWSTIDCDDNGVLGGFAHLSPPDLKESEELLLKFLPGLEKKICCRLWSRDWKDK